MSLAGEIASVVAPVFIIAALGYLWARLGGQFDAGMIAALVMNFGTPCLVLDTFLRAKPSAEAFAQIAVAGLALFIGFAIVGLVSLRLMKKSYRDFLPSILFPNTGNMGLPLSLFAFGQEGLALAIAIFALSAIGNFTIGTSLAAGKADPKSLARMPILYAVALAVTLTLTGFEMPEWAGNTVHLLGGLTIPLMLLALGVSLSRLTVKSLPMSLAVALIRIAGGFGIGLLVCWAFDLQGAAKGAVLLQATMPVAVFNYLFAERYGRAAAEVAGAVLLSTVLSFAVVPLLLWYLL